MKRRNFPVKYKNVSLPPIKGLRRLAYKKVFEGLNYLEDVNLDRGLRLYPKADLTVKEINELISINGIMVKLEKGEFKEEKEKFKEFKLNYKDIYGLS